MKKIGQPERATRSSIYTFVQWISQAEVSPDSNPSWKFSGATATYKDCEKSL